MTNLQMMEEIRPMLDEIGKNLAVLDPSALRQIHILVTDINASLQLLVGRLNTTDHCIQQLQKRHAELDDKVMTLDEKNDDALRELSDARDDLDVRG